VGVPMVIRALSKEVRGRYGASEGMIAEKTMDRARALRGEWRVIPDSGTSI
jgi:hypothetical protein